MNKLVTVCVGIISITAAHSSAFAEPNRAPASQPLNPAALGLFGEVQDNCKAVSDTEFSIDVSTTPSQILAGEDRVVEMAAEHLVLEFKAHDRSIQLRPRTAEDLERGFKQSDVIAQGKTSQEGRATTATLLGFRAGNSKKKPRAECLQAITSAVAHLYHARLTSMIQVKSISSLTTGTKVIPEAISITEPSEGSVSSGAGK